MQANAMSWCLTSTIAVLGHPKPEATAVALVRMKEPNRRGLKAWAASAFLFASLIGLSSGRVTRSNSVRRSTQVSGEGFELARVVRGGSWDLNARPVRAACRSWDAPDDRGSLGFRCARVQD